MKDKEQLFELVKSMNSNEKGYFKKFCKIYSSTFENIYFKVFSLIEKQEKYDEQGIIKSIYKNKKISNFSRTKSYLYHLILKSMRNYYSERKCNQLSILLDDIEFLHSKALHKQCQNIIRKGIKLSQSMEDYNLTMKFLDWESTYLLTNNPKKNIDDKLNDNRKALKEAYKKTENINQYRKILMEMRNAIFDKGFIIREHNAVLKINKLIQSPFLKDEQLAQSNTAKDYMFTALIMYNNAIGDWNNYLKYSYAHFNIIKNKNKHLYNTDKNIVSIWNILVGLFKTRKFEDIPIILKELTEIKTSDEESNTMQQTTYLHYEINYFIRTGQFKNLQNAAIDINNLLKTKNKYLTIGDKIELYFDLFYLHFVTNDFENALLWINTILNLNKQDLRLDVISFARIFNLLIHFELNNFRILEYQIYSTERFLNKNKVLFESEKVILQFLKKYLDEPEKTKRKRIIEKSIEKMMLLSKNPKEERFYEFFGFIDWLKSKLENTSIDILIKRNQSRPK